MDDILKKQKRLPASVRRRHIEDEQFEFRKYVPIDKRKRTKKKKPLGLSQKLEIIHQAYIGMLKHKEIAKIHGISMSHLAQITKKGLKNANVLEEMVHRKDLKLEQRRNI